MREVPAGERAGGVLLLGTLGISFSSLRNSLYELMVEKGRGEEVERSAGAIIAA